MNKETYLDWISTYKEALLLALLCFAVLFAADTAGVWAGMIQILPYYLGLVFLLIIPVHAGYGPGFSIVLGALALRPALLLAAQLHFVGLGGLFLTCLTAMAIAAAMGAAAGWLQALRAHFAFLLSLAVGFFALGVSSLFPAGTFPSALLHALGGVMALPLIRLAFTALVAAAFLIILLRSVRGRPVPWVTLCAVLLFSGLGVAVTFLPFVEGLLMTDRLLVYPLLLFFSSAAILFQLVKLLLFRFVYRRPYSLARGFGACLAAAAVYFAAILPQSEALLQTLSLPAAPVLLAAAIPAAVVALVHTGPGNRMKGMGEAEAARRRKRADMGTAALTAALSAFCFLLMAEGRGAVPTAQEAQRITLHAIAALLFGGGSLRRASAGQALLGAALFFLFAVSAPIAAQRLYSAPGIGEGFVDVLALGMIASITARHFVRLRGEAMPRILNLKPMEARDAVHS